ncbi:hypothetical protein TH53_06965 [Pedobacter lusitanus]|uniref:(2E)-enoyl-[ACP] glycyltransferase n=2 Tax=Pedobacter lusitanus TaxID=1503925 RepID=A0A0D0F8C4_9SPHI|nr:hypothetical protein TH53_06965 [Pedobacter lusitanus]
MESGSVIIDPDFIHSILNPYRDHASYLKQAVFHVEPGKKVQGLKINGQFAIAESCYIDDTGHFNAVEYNICYNQLGYVFLGHCIKNQLIPELADYTEETFFHKQLSHVLIVKISSSFSQLINAKDFSGTWGITAVKKTTQCTFLYTYCNFQDIYGGSSKGEVVLGILPAKEKS